MCIRDSVRILRDGAPYLDLRIGRQDADQLLADPGVARVRGTEPGMRLGDEPGVERLRQIGSLGQRPFQGQFGVLGHGEDGFERGGQVGRYREADLGIRMEGEAGGHG